ncbi:TetR/AcrR family transcriptional regulator [Cryobacterium sp. SO2]|uniref:TetR/AcrR family transcriptional regulator n=1 Tax=Cryobacterium sp. SO2 TaxID=1897060 RepID=UPI00223CA56F|nr:TetR/AcrR family transcriptional regulator [Cryobacterium sp. SO2]WEO77215.1 TetR/AcrR family transcriptional regulator [Cryobacterium sp. SO2]
MTTAVVVKTVREGSARKRAAILAAARSLFLSDGFDRTSMDAIASAAAVSKRTVYDYYGDKRTLLLAVVEQALQALGMAVSGAIDEHLTDVTDVETALIGFADSITATAIGSADYSALMRLLSTESDNLPEMRDKHWDSVEPEEAVAERFVELDRQGLLTTPDPRLAADHFVALALSRSVYALGRQDVRPPAETRKIIVDGVQAFLRAYGATPGVRRD